MIYRLDTGNVFSSTFQHVPFLCISYVNLHMLKTNTKLRKRLNNNQWKIKKKSKITFTPQVWWLLWISVFIVCPCSQVEEKKKAYVIKHDILGYFCGCSTENYMNYISIDFMSLYVLCDFFHSLFCLFTIRPFWQLLLLRKESTINS